MTEETNIEATNIKQNPRNKDIPANVQPYFIALLYRGDRWNDTQGPEAADLVPRQLAFIREQVEAGRYLLAGPITGDGQLIGISILSAPTVAEAITIANADPGVKAGRIRVEMHSAYLPSLKELKITYP